MIGTPPIALDRDANYEAGEVALWLRETRRVFARKLVRRVAQDGFPKAFTQWGKKVWSGAALLDWRDDPQKTVTLSDKVTPLAPLLAARAKVAARMGARKRA